jgi:hypothetical protein
MKYTNMEKQPYYLVKSLKCFIDYNLHSHIITYVPFSTIKDILVQNGSEVKKGKWISKLEEY